MHPQQNPSRPAIFELIGDDYRGNALYFCSDECRTAFHDDGRVTFDQHVDGFSNEYDREAVCPHCSARVLVREARKGMLVSIYRDASGGDCSLGGVSSRYTEALVVGPGVPDIFEEDAKRPTLEVYSRQIGGKPYSVVRPLGAKDMQHAFGGNYAQSCDSRFVRLFPPYGIVPIHDREHSRERG